MYRASSDEGFFLFCRWSTNAALEVPYRENVEGQDSYAFSLLTFMLQHNVRPFKLLEWISMCFYT